MLFQEINIRISALETMDKIVRCKYLLSSKKDAIFHIIDQRKGTVVNQAFSSLNGGSLEITRIVHILILNGLLNAESISA